MQQSCCNQGEPQLLNNCYMGGNPRHRIGYGTYQHGYSGMVTNNESCIFIFFIISYVFSYVFDRTYLRSSIFVFSHISTTTTATIILPRMDDVARNNNAVAQA